MYVLRPKNIWFYAKYSVNMKYSKHLLHIYGTYHVKIKFLVSQKTHSDSNFNQKFDYNYGMQGLTFNLSQLFTLLLLAPALVVLVTITNLKLCLMRSTIFFK